MEERLLFAPVVAVCVIGGVMPMRREAGDWALGLSRSLRQVPRMSAARRRAWSCAVSAPGTCLEGGSFGLPAAIYGLFPLSNGQAPPVRSRTAVATRPRAARGRPRRYMPAPS